jgi:glycosyltransferase involved in cell wall biosynthesis
MSIATLLNASELAGRPPGGPTEPRRSARDLVIIGNSLPRLCGIATFTNHLEAAIAAARPALGTSIVAMSDPGQVYAYPSPVRLTLREERIEDYRRAAAALNAGGCDAVCLQHEFGIFGGEAGADVLALLTPLTMPIVTTLHTVLASPTTAQHDVMRRIIELSSSVVVMAAKGRDLLQSVYRAPAGKIELIAHGIPDFPFVEPDAAKARHGLTGKTVILTFGLLSPSKGVDVMIEAMPEVLAQCPEALYLVLGATHPSLVRQRGEAYRQSLEARVAALGLGGHVIFLDRFVDQATLLDYLSLCDVYVTPYRNEAQLTSGTLAYSFGLGKAIVSTPYWHARELLADGLGVLVPFDDAGAFGREVAALLTDEPRRQAMRLRAYENSRGMIWAHTAERYLAVIDEAVRVGRTWPRTPSVAAQPPSPPAADAPLPEVVIGHLLAMCDDTGIFQHAIHSVPDRRHGYCVDDNARALLLASRANQPGERRLPEALTGRFASFVQHAYNPDTKRFRNFMSFDRRWLEDQGSEDSHGRALWSLGACAAADASAPRRRWAAGLFRDALPVVESFGSPRAFAFTLLGLNAYLGAAPGDWRADRLRAVLADRLLAGLAAHEGPEWIWFEATLAYDNARLPEALIRTGSALGAPAYLRAGLRSLSWLAGVQTGPAGLFRPVGTEGFQEIDRAPRAFDQQPVEAAASISAFLAAAEAERRGAWPALADAAFAWFLGANDLAAVMVDPDTGGCRDGLHPDRPNENQGAESVLSYLLGLVDMRQMARMGLGSARSPPPLALSA